MGCYQEATIITAWGGSRQRLNTDLPDHLVVIRVPLSYNAHKKGQAARMDASFTHYNLSVLLPGILIASSSYNKPPWSRWWPCGHVCSSLDMLELLVLLTPLALFLQQWLCHYLEILRSYLTSMWNDALSLCNTPLMWWNSPSQIRGISP